MTQSELESRIQVLLAGTVAEEMIFDDVSTGAQNDLERATEIARSMVMDFGMSRLGRVNYRESAPRRRSSATRPTTPRPRTHSEQTAREIDEEIRRIIDQSLEKVRHILESRPQGPGGAGRAADREGSDRHGRVGRDRSGPFAGPDPRPRHHRGHQAPRAARPRAPGRRSGGGVSKWSVVSYRPSGVTFFSFMNTRRFPRRSSHPPVQLRSISEAHNGRIGPRTDRATTM